VGERKTAIRWLIGGTFVARGVLKIAKRIKTEKLVKRDS